MQKKVYEVIESGYEPGKVIFKGEIYNPYTPDLDDPCKIIYDPSTGNIHLFPENLDKAKYISECIRKQLDNIAKSDKWKSSKWGSLTPKKRGYGNVPTFTKFKKCEGLKYLYAFLSVEVNNIIFDLLPFRFEKENNKINCEFGAYQFGVEINKMKAFQLYPAKDKKDFVLDDKQVYFSPGICFESEEDVVQKFLDYIEFNVRG
ncbi:hypothetical protein DWY35_08510 [Ruminococcus sp. AF25-13]|jgi:hypothetical protein|nr:hypothetical protein DXD07_01940 [Ruminococcus sp. TF10-6]RGF27505.1 hypothetical protein DW106_09160 [Ruminococcus sp. AM09-18-1]RGG28804.1 hypothetical protein DWY35_08510 [Ruminococcus sp. AF25-13]RGG35508.1 hypothetical protein DWY13_12295 [Ruminococcus sp. AF24-16]RGI13229.1 hypothetical protein DXD00_12695 [Ruminococcus sp. TF10-12AC]